MGHENEQELRELQDPAAWDDESVEVLPPVKAPRAIVSVAFSRADLGQIAAYAQRHGMKLSEFIRKAALELAAQPLASRSEVISITDGRGGFQRNDANRTGGVRGVEFEHEVPAAVTTSWS